jgi:hypothetical protein
VGVVGSNPIAPTNFPLKMLLLQDVGRLEIAVGRIIQCVAGQHSLFVFGFSQRSPHAEYKSR